MKIIRTGKMGAKNSNDSDQRSAQQATYNPAYKTIDYSNDYASKSEKEIGYEKERNHQGA